MYGEETKTIICEADNTLLVKCERNIDERYKGISYEIWHNREMFKKGIYGDPDQGYIYLLPEPCHH